MAFSKFTSLSSLSLAGVVLLIGGLGIALFASQQQQDNRSKAAEPSNDNTTVVTNYGSDYSGTQGQKGWYYGYSNGGFNGSNFQQMNVHSGGIWYVDPNKYWAQITQSGMHPNSTTTSWPRQPGAWFDVIKRWVSTVSGEVTISGKVADADPGSSSGVDGVSFSIWLDGQKIHEGHINNGNTGGVTYSLTKTVNVGSKIDFAVGPDSSDYNDTTVFDVIVSKEEEPSPSLPPPSLPPPAEISTTFRLDLMIHGIGDGKFEGEDPNIAWGGEDPISSKQERDVKVEVYEITGQGLGAKVAEGTGKVKYQNGGYKSVAPIDMGASLAPGNYNVRMISGPAIRTDSRTIQQGETTITMTLKNGDANLDKNLTLIDYNLIYSCVRDELVGKLPTTTQCSNTNKEKADIDNDGEVTWFDYNLVVRELTNQVL